MPREMERPGRGRQKERDAPSGQEIRTPERGDVDSSSVKETLLKERAHKRDVGERGNTQAVHDYNRSIGNRDAHRKFSRSRVERPIKAVGTERINRQDDALAFDDIIRSQETSEPAGNEKRRPRLKFVKEDSQPKPSTQSGKTAAIRYRSKNDEKEHRKNEGYRSQKNSGSIGKPTAAPDSAKVQGQLVQRKKIKRRLMFEGETKKGISVVLPVKAGANATLSHAHKMMEGSEHENVGVEAARKGVSVAENSVRTAKHGQQASRRRRASTAKLKQKEARLNTKLAYQKSKPTAVKSKKARSLTRAAQKRRIRRQYAKAAREARNAARRAKKAGDATKSAAGFIRRHPVAFLVILLIVLIVIIIATVVSSFSGVASEGAGVILSTSYLAPDEDIEAAELAYTEWETDLQIEINNVESARPGYDEYRYSVDDIGHGPHELMAYLTAVYNDFRFVDIESDLRGIFDAQYQLTYTEETETRTETRTIEVGGAIGQVRTTGYCHCSKCNGQWAGGPTASGVMPKASHTIAVDAYNPIVPMGTKVVINGVIYTVEDTGNLNANNSDFDIFFNSHAEALAWGRRNHTAYLAEGNGNTLEVTTTYEARILNVNLTARSFTDVIWPSLDVEQMERYNLLARVKGNRQYAGSPFNFNWLPYVADGYGWRVHPTTGGKDMHKGVDIAVATGTEIIAAHDGTVTFAGNSGDYGQAVFLEDEKSVETRYAGCSELLVSQGQIVKMGDVIAKVGSTGDGSGPSLHFEVMKNGRHLNPLYFSITNDDGSSYIPPGSPGGVDFPDYPGAPMDNARFATMMEEAQKHLGKPYVFGASGPNSFDCSGFVSYVLSNSVYPGFGRTTAQGLYNICTPVSRANAQPGDLIFFTRTYNAGRPVTHVGIYIGNGQMIHAGKPVQYSSIDTIYWTSHFYALGRLPV